MQIYVKVAWPPLPVDAGPDWGANNQHPEIIQAAMQLGLLVAVAVVIVGTLLLVVRGLRKTPT
jgi:hypothetical protein